MWNTQSTRSVHAEPSKMNKLGAGAMLAVASLAGSVSAQCGSTVLSNNFNQCVAHDSMYHLLYAWFPRR